MLDLTSDLPLFHERGESENSSSRSSDSGLEIPTSFQLLDISEDNKFLALIDDNSMLQVYELNDIKDQLTAKRQTMTDIPCEIKCKNSIFVYISVASETGHVAVSFLQTDKRGDPFENSSKFDQFTKFKIHRKNDTKEEKEQQHCNEEGKETLDNNYSTCRIYQGNQGHVLEKPFQGRAAFTKNRLILIGQYTLDIYDANTLNKMYFFKHGGFCLNKQIYQGRNWYRGYFLQDECAKLPNAGYGLVRISEHVRKNVIVVYDEDCSVYRRTSVKIWSILTGSLICSFMQIDDEQVIYVSEDHRFLVSQKVFRGALNIYCMKSGAHLYMYEPQKVSDGILRYNIMLVKPIANQNYMLLIGTVFRRNCGSDESEGLSFANYLFFEIFLIEQQTTVKDIQTSMIIGLNSHLALGIFQNEDFINTTSQFYGVFWEKMNNDDRYLNLRTIQFNFPSSDSIHLTYPTSNGLLQNTLWNIFKCTHIGTEDEGGFRRALTSHDFRYDDGFTSDDKTIVYLLENSIHKYVLIISPYIVQLWRLYKDEALEYNTLFFDSLPRKKNCYLDFHDNSLIYTRSHYGLNYEESACGDTPKLMLEGENQYYRPRVQFLENLGHIFVHVESKSGSSISEEIILPLSVSQSTDNSDDTINDLSQDEFHSIERCLLSFLHTYWSREQRDMAFDYFLLRPAEGLLKAVFTLINNTAYFQTMSASKILMRLAYLDKGMEIITDIVLQKGSSVAIHNFPMGDNKNLLTVLIQKKKLDLFQILFNQVIIDYNNEISVNLFPLIDALLCLKENNLTDNLSYLPVNLSMEGLLESELQTLGDQKSFKNFTVFHQMKKRKVGTLLLYVDMIISLIRPQKKKIERVPTYYTENYFISNQICLLPLPDPRIYDVISFAILAKNSPYSRTDSSNETFRLKSPIIEVLLAHRWRNHVKVPFYFLLLIHIVYYIFYTVAISFPEEIFDYNPGSSIQRHSHLVCLAIVLLTWILFLLEEMKQIIILKWKYWKSAYNYIDLLALIFPLVTFILLITDGPHLYDISSLTTLILWLHFILRLRANRRIGILIEIIIQLGVKIAPIIGLMILIIIAFTHSFAVLLRRQDDSFFQEQFQGNVALENDGNLGQNVAMSDQSQQNIFKDAFLAFGTVWFFLYGIFDPILSGDVGNYPMALVLAILFSFITALVILNVVIALMTGAIDETEKKGNRNWHIHLADISNEAESLLGWLITKHSSPIYMYYHASTNDIELQRKKIEKETKRLRDKLAKRRGKEEGKNSL